MLKVGLTGGIGSGKSSVAGLFASLGVPVIDTDTISRELAQTADVIAEIASAFGDRVVDAGGNLDRARLADIVFGDEQARRKLEAIMHPKIRREIARRLDRLGRQPYTIIVVPLLLETDFYTLVDRILVIDATREEQIRRVRERDGRSDEAIQAIMNIQIDRHERLQRADDVVDNCSDFGHLQQQVNALHKQYLHTDT